MIDWSPIRLGDIVSFLGFALGGLSVIFMMKSDIRALALRLGFLEETVKKETSGQNKKIDEQGEKIDKFGEFLTLMGRYEERMSTMRKHIDELRHGRGFIVQPPPPFREDGA